MSTSASPEIATPPVGPSDRPSEGDAASTARHPRACRQCAVTKIKCTFRPGSGSRDPCDRCRRLGKDCQVQQAAPGPRKRKVKETRVAQLEKKIDGLYNLLNQSRDTGHQAPTPMSSTAETASTKDTAPDNVTLPQGDHVSLNAMMPVEEETEKLFQYFQERMAIHFPFVYIPLDKTAGEVRTETPFLFKEIITTAAWSNLHEQRESQKHLVAELVQRLLLKGEKTMDILQGLLILISFFQPYMFTIPMMTSLLHLGFALVIDLGLNRAPQTREIRGVDNFTRRMAHGEAANRTSDSPDQMRAFLGSFYLHSVLSKSFRAMDGPRSTSYIEHCCNRLLELKESPYDARLVYMVRIQQFSEEIGPNIASELAREPGSVMKAPLSFYVSSMAARLKDIKATLQDSHVLADTSARIGAGAAEIHLWEYAYYTSLSTSTSHSSASSASSSSDYLYRCLSAISETMTLHCTIAPAEYFNLPMTYWAHMSELLTVLFKLFRPDGRSNGRESKAHMYAVLDPSQVMAEMIERFTRAAREAGVEETSGLFVYIARRVEMFKGWLQDRQFPFSAQAGAQAAAAVGSLPALGGGGMGSVGVAVGNMDWLFTDEAGITNGGLFGYLPLDDGFMAGFMGAEQQQQQQQQSGQGQGLPQVQTVQQQQRGPSWDALRTFGQGTGF